MKKFRISKICATLGHGPKRKIIKNKNNYFKCSVKKNAAIYLRIRIFRFSKI